MFISDLYNQDYGSGGQLGSAKESLVALKNVEYSGIRVEGLGGGETKGNAVSQMREGQMRARPHVVSKQHLVAPGV